MSEPVVVRWVGSADVAVAPALEHELDRAVAAAGGRVVIDMSEVRFIDSSALGILVHAAEAARPHGVGITLRSMPANVHRLLDLTGLSALFTFEDPD
ncbi:STAS domain-containing protein [Jatrophihabitans endophyticus]|uniref:STAS domain-containing protein n=1 Tax=Jatrophihabitans endophyticus TaxID=1206085 RepID=UPI0019FFEC19|nr:STAS domain-containing protein [Jatrophihabitans endophyticus]MBE7189488.1 STAS domain-containing protein [Jatrophihabitans endophyticus]